MSASEDIQLQNTLDSITARLQGGEAVEPLLTEAEKSQGDLGEFVDIIQSLHTSLTPISPSQDYADRLRADLLNGRPGVVKRVRQIPPRVHVAAILAVCAGCVLFVLRRIFGSATAQDIQEEAVATPL
ncbi:MAG: hypothetical protein OXI30_18150 [Chloroflexota bacterium]|nr:hypothetical protein [Chloroflexota bacterium]